MGIAKTPRCPSPASIRISAEDHFGLKCAVENDWVSRYGTAALAIVVVGLVCWAATTWIPHNPVDTGGVRPVDGLTIFAVFFVAALAIERLLEPLSNAMLPRATRTQDARDAMKQAGKAATEYLDQTAEAASADQNQPGGAEGDGEVDAGDAPTATEPYRPEGGDNRPATARPTASASSVQSDPADSANHAIRKAAKAMEALSVRQLQRTTAFWAIATCLGMLMAAAMNL